MKVSYENCIAFLEFSGCLKVSNVATPKAEIKTMDARATRGWPLL